MERCKTCKYWLKKSVYWLSTGECTRLTNSENVTINLVYGHDGGYVDYIDTEADFGCTEHEPYKEDEVQ